MESTKYAGFGAVSEGTLRSEDLLNAFASELGYQYGRQSAEWKAEHSELKSLIAEANAALENEDAPENEDEPEEEASDLVNRLQDALGAFAPEYAYFGSLEGDGACFGFWPDVARLEEAVRDGEVVKCEAGGEYPPDSEVIVVNDHGNVTYGTTDAQGALTEIWSCV